MEDSDDKPNEEHIHESVSLGMSSLFGHPDPDNIDENLPLEYFDEKEYFEANIQDKLSEVKRLCEERRIPFLAMVTLSRRDNPEFSEEMQEDFGVTTTDPEDLRVGYIHRGALAVALETNHWTIGPSVLLSLNANLRDLIGGLSDADPNA